jgi:hypothetical protein
MFPKGFFGDRFSRSKTIKIRIRQTFKLSRNYTKKFKIMKYFFAGEIESFIQIKAFHLTGC